MASGAGRPGPGRLADSVARHPWVTAAGLTATIAAVAGGGLALAFSGGSARPAGDCGLVPCTAALPASVRTSAAGPGSGPVPGRAPATATPTVTQRAPAPPSSPLPSSAATAPEAAAPHRAGPAPEPVSFPAPAASSAGRAVSADHAVGVGYGITQDGQQGIHGQIVIVNNGPVPLTGWRIRVVLPGDTDYQVLDAANRSAGRRPGHGGSAGWPGHRRGQHRGDRVHRPGHDQHAGPVHVHRFRPGPASGGPGFRRRPDAGAGQDAGAGPARRRPGRAATRGGRADGWAAGSRAAGRTVPGPAGAARATAGLAAASPGASTAGDRAPAAPRRPVGFVP